MGRAASHRGSTIEYANDAFCELVGVDIPTAVTGRSLEQSVANSDRDRFVGPFEALLGGKGSVDGLALDLETGNSTRTNVIAVGSPRDRERGIGNHGTKMPLQRAKSTRSRPIYRPMTASSDAIELATTEPRASVFTPSVPAGGRPDHERASLGSRG